jgi:Protein of unknown function (DUF4031)
VILVDDLTEYPDDWVTGAARKHGKRWCHLMSDDSLVELHAFAQSIGLRREWSQGDHYDLTPGMRAKALRFGATAVSDQEIVRRGVRA